MEGISTSETGPTTIQLTETHAGLPDTDPVDLADAAPASGVPDDEAGWLSLSLITAAWCPVPALTEGSSSSTPAATTASTPHGPRPRPPSTYIRRHRPGERCGSPPTSTVPP